MAKEQYYSLSDSETFGMPGRPPVDPMQKVSIPMRCLITPLLARAVAECMKVHDDVTMSDLMRLGLYRLLDNDGLIEKYGLREDLTWKVLQSKGLV